MTVAGKYIAGATLSALLAACSGAPGSQASPTPPAAATAPAQTPAAQQTTAPTETRTAITGQTILTVWMPDTMYDATDAPGRQAFLDQLATFDDQHPDIQVQVYAKRLRGPGGMLSYLQTGPPVAPTILPDLALVDRDALVETAHAQLAPPIDGVIGQAYQADLYPAALETGRVGDALEGLPYLVEVDHVAYRQTVLSTPPLTFSQVLETGQLFVFAGGVSSGVSPVVLLQYLAAGGTLANDKGAPAIDPAALTAVLEFYSQARVRHDVTSEVFQLPDTAAVWAVYRDRRANLAAVTSTQYLAGLAQVTSTRAGAIPTSDGKPAALARGWSWLLLAHDPDRQTAALALLNFLMSPANQGRYSEAAHYLPTQPAALALWASQDSGYPAFADQLLTNARPMPDSTARVAIGVAMQDALEAVVLNGVQPAQAATRAADSVNTGQPSQP